MKKYLAALLVFASFGTNFTLTELTHAQTEEKPTEEIFNDLRIGSEYYVGIKYLKDLNLIHGYPDGSFKAKQPINRAEALKVLVGAIKLNQFSNTERPIVNLQSTQEIEYKDCSFPDIDKDAWYYEYICAAYNNQIITGYPDGTFKPEQTINKVEALKIAILQSGLSTATPSAENFDDVKTTDWYNDYARLANHKGMIVEDREGMLNAGDLMTRGEFVMMIYRTLRAFQNNSEFGRATFYGGRFDGKTSASGEIFLSTEMTAAHKTLPFGTIVRVTNLSNGKQVDVRINDRGPYVNGTIIDLSSAAFEKVSSLSTGIFHSEVEIISQP
jgi:rare lipoprotein A (peptidoglycan hydrolase)